MIVSMLYSNSVVARSAHPSCNDQRRCTVCGGVENNEQQLRNCGMVVLQTVTPCVEPE